MAFEVIVGDYQGADSNEDYEFYPARFPEAYFEPENPAPALIQHPNGTFFFVCASCMVALHRRFILPHGKPKPMAIRLTQEL